MGTAILTWIIENFFLHVVYPMAMDFAQKRETDPKFKSASDIAYGDVAVAQTTADRKAAARKLYELQNSS